MIIIISIVINTITGYVMPWLVDERFMFLPVVLQRQYWSSLARSTICLNNASFFFLFKYFLCQGYELSGEIALKNNHYYYYYLYRATPFPILLVWLLSPCLSGKAEVVA